jgi:hypothetical protein
MRSDEKIELYARLLGKIYNVQVVLSDISYIAEQLGRADLDQEATKLASHYDDVEQELNAAYDKELSDD